MKIGLFMMPLHPPARLFHETLQEDMAKAILADTLGFEELWVGQHFSATTEPITSPLMFLAAILHRTTRIKLATGVISLPAHHPATVAAEVAMFDHLSQGRFIFGIGPGGLACDYELYGNTDAAIRNEKLEESIDTILKLWAQDPPYEIAGKHWSITLTKAIDPALGIGFMQKPFQKPHPEIASSAMSPFSSSVKTAAMRGWNPVSANFTPEYSVASHWTKYVEGCSAVGREPKGEEWRVARNIIVAETDDEAYERAHDPAGSDHYYFWYIWKALLAGNYTVAMKRDPKLDDGAVTSEMLIDDLVIYGSPSTVVEKLRAFRERVGPFGTLLMAGLDWDGVNAPREQESMKLLAERVRPELVKF